jgi:tetratricopeptide (TPR) repeat protein
LIQEALVDARASHDKNALAWSLYLLGNITWLGSGDVDTAATLLEEALVLSSQVRDFVHQIWVLFTLAACARVRGRFDQAESCYSQLLTIVDDRRVSVYHNWQELLAGALVGMAGVALDQGDPTHAARLFGAARRSPDPISISFRLNRQADFATARDQLGRERFAAAFAEGKRMESGEAISFAVQRVATTTS